MGTAIVAAVAATQARDAAALTDLTLDDFMAPIIQAARTHFVTATAAARRMAAQRSGVIVMLSSSAAQESRLHLACASIEALTRSLAGEVGRHGVRVVGLRPNFTPETLREDVDPSQLEPLLRDTLLGRLPRLDEVANTAAFLASSHAGAMTAAIANLNCGAMATRR